MSIRLQVLYLVAFSLVFGVFFVTRRGRAMVGYAALLGANLLLVLMLIGTGRLQGPSFWLAIGCFLLLVVIPSTLRALQYRLLAADRLRGALLLARAREILQPGAGVAREREMLSAVAMAREGRTQAAIDHLENWASRGGRDRMLEAQEQIVAIFLMERRFAEAIAYGEAIDPQNRPLLQAGLVRAHLETGDLARAAEALRQLEGSPLADSEAAELVNQARLQFLAHAGEAEAIASLLAPGSGFLPRMSDKARAYWRGVALMRAGRVDSGRAELLRAQASASPDEERFRTAIRACLSAGAGDPAPESVVRYAREVALRARVHRAVPRGGKLLQVAPITVGLGAALALIWILVETSGSSSDPWTLIRAGAHFGPAVRAGEWWRMVTATFLHGGLIHLALNVYALWAFGPFVERLYGSTRFLIIYVASGVAGFAASLRFGGGPLSVGASGCIFGVLGAAIAILLVRRGHWPEGWRRGMLMNFAFLVAVNVGIGFIMPMIDNAAHVGGLVGGLSLGLLLAPGVLGSGDLARAALWAMATTAMAAVIGSAIGLLTSDSAALLTRLPTRPLRLGDVVLLAPEHWVEAGDGRGQVLLDGSGAVGALFGDIDPSDAERGLAASLEPDRDSFALDVSCRRLKPGPTLCLRFPHSGRAAYLPLLKSMVATARAAGPGAPGARP